MAVTLFLTYDFITSFNLALQIGFSFLLGCASYFSIWTILPGGFQKIIEFVSYPLSLIKYGQKTAVKETT